MNILDALKTGKMKMTVEPKLTGGSKLTGDTSGLRGDCTGLRGDCSEAKRQFATRPAEKEKL